MTAIGHALSVISWMELGDDCPPASMWLNSEELETWFEAVKSGHGHAAEPDDDEEAELMDLDDPLIQMWRNG